MSMIMNQKHYFAAWPRSPHRAGHILKRASMRRTIPMRRLVSLRAFVCNLYCFWNTLPHKKLSGTGRYVTLIIPRRWSLLNSWRQERAREVQKDTQGKRERREFFCALDNAVLVTGVYLHWDVCVRLALSPPCGSLVSPRGPLVKTQ